MTRRLIPLASLSLSTALVLLATAAAAPQDRSQDGSGPPKLDPSKGQAKTPTELPRIPPPDPGAALLPAGFRAEVVLADLTYPTSVAFDDAGALYVAEGGYIDGDAAAPARVWRVGPGGARHLVAADGLHGPVNDLLWHGGRLYISHRGKISTLEGGRLRDLVTDLPSGGDHTNNQMAVGPDGKLYFGQGTVTNSGVVGLDNILPMGGVIKDAEVHDVPAKDLKLKGQEFETPDPITLLNQKEMRQVKTSAFHPFGQTGDSAKGATKANGTILRMNPDGSGLEVYAWGLRNPFGLAWTADGKLLAFDNGYDERGSRPIANAPDCLWQIKPGAWYGFPDFAGGEPVTGSKFKSSRGPAPEFLLADHPEVETPLVSFPPHTGGTKLAVSPGGAFGRGQIYAANAGDYTPITGPEGQRVAPAVSRIDPATWKVEPFFRARPEALGPKGFEYAATAGPRRLVDARFTPRGDALYVVDVGGLTTVPSAIGPIPQPFPRSGVVWRITPRGAATTP